MGLVERVKSKEAIISWREECYTSSTLFAIDLPCAGLNDPHPPFTVIHFTGVTKSHSCVGRLSYLVFLFSPSFQTSFQSYLFRTKSRGRSEAKICFLDRAPCLQPLICIVTQEWTFSKSEISKHSSRCSSRRTNKDR